MMGNKVNKMQGLLTLCFGLLLTPTSLPAQVSQRPGTILPIAWSK